MVSFSKPCMKQPIPSSACLLSSGNRISQALPAVVISGRPSRFAGGRRTAFGLPSVSAHGRRAIQPGLGSQREQDRKPRSRRFGRSSAEHFMHLPTSQPLKPQSSMPERFCISPFAPAAQHIYRSLGSQGRRTSSRFSSSKQERVGSQQPPNPSFKRTRLRRSA